MQIITHLDNFARCRTQETGNWNFDGNYKEESKSSSLQEDLRT